MYYSATLYCGKHDLSIYKLILDTGTVVHPQGTYSYQNICYAKKINKLNLVSSRQTLVQEEVNLNRSLRLPPTKI